jgi:DNA (cytosine-5)-methyltransferase 1
VFVVGYLGDWRPAAEVLFEPESLLRDTAPSRKSGEEIAGTIAARFGISRNNHEECVATFDRQSSGEYGTAPIASTISARDYKSPTDLVYSLQGAGSTSKTANGSGWNEELSFTLNSTDVHGVAQPVAFQLAGDRDNPSVSVSNVAFCLPANPMSDRGQAVAQSMAVRRLTPIECERLQGFPDNYTNIAYRNKTDSPDSPRYKSLGNSMAVPVMSWIGKKIEMVNKNLNNEG